MSPEERSICLVAAALLRRGRTLHALSISVTIVTLLAAALTAFRPEGLSPHDLSSTFAAAMTAAVMLAGLLQLALAMRVAFDADLFAAIAAGNLDLQPLDRALAKLRLMPDAKAGRALEPRLDGARRLLALQLGALVLQLLLFAVWLVLLCFLR